MPVASFHEMIAPHPKAIQAMALALREIILDTLPQVDEAMVGGAKVGLALYSRDGPAKVLCGIQPCGESCLLYVHHLKQLDHPRLKLEGKGKHAKHIRFLSLDEINTEDVASVLRQVEEGAEG